MNPGKGRQELEIKSLFFSEEARRELGVLSAAVREILQLTTDCYINTDHEMAHHVEPLEQVIDALTKEIKQKPSGTPTGGPLFHRAGIYPN